MVSEALRSRALLLSATTAVHSTAGALVSQLCGPLSEAPLGCSYARTHVAALWPPRDKLSRNRRLSTCATLLPMAQPLGHAYPSGLMMPTCSVASLLEIRGTESRWPRSLIRAPPGRDSPSYRTRGFAGDRRIYFLADPVSSTPPSPSRSNHTMERRANLPDPIE